MLLFAPRQAADPAAPTVAIFGLGLVGAAIARAISLHAPTLREASRQRIDWGHGTIRASQLETAASTLLETRRATTAGGSGEPRVELVWSAGSAGFGAGADVAAREFDAFRDVAGLGTRLAEQLPRSAVTLHVVSSAGALFEGQRLVDRESRPDPRRPYGRLKLRQERHLLECCNNVGKRIYRVSSAYGYPVHGHRRGLLTTLVQNGILGRETTITGHPDSLRDFVCADDVGRFVARQIARPPPPPRAPDLLVSGCPHSLHEVQRLVEDYLGRNLYVSYSTAGSNAAYITFRGNACNADFHTEALGTGVRRIRDWVLHGQRRPAHG